MVYEVMQTRNKIFLETLAITLVILIVGFAIGFFVESYRADKIFRDYKAFEVESLDLKMQTYYLETIESSSCASAIQENINFADRVYNEGLLIQKYEDESELTQNILLEKKRYVLLDEQLWINSMILRKKCDNPFHTLIYVYSQNPDSSKEAEQAAISKTLQEIKQERGNDIILVPIAGDMGIISIESQLRNYNITYLPSVLIDEKTVLAGFNTKDDILKYFVSSPSIIRLN